MSAALRRLAALDRRWFGLVAAGLLVGLAIADDAAVLRGLFAGFLVLLAVPTGAMLLLLIHRLTGGAWGEARRPVLSAAALALPAISFLILPVLVFPSEVFRWAADPGAIRHEDVARWYLNPLGLAFRSALTLLLWSALAVLAATPHRLGKGLAALGLALFGLTISFSAMDWVLSLDPRFKSTAFAMSWALAFLLSGAGWTAAMSQDKRATADIAKLVTAFALGLLYLDLMQFLVAYDGNLPDKAAWYLRRASLPALATIGFAFVGAALLPFLAALKADWRASPRIGRVAGAAAILGVAARTLWWTAPEWSPSLVFWLAFLLTGLVALGLAAALGAFFAARIGRRAVHGV